MRHLNSLHNWSSRMETDIGRILLLGFMMLTAGCALVRSEHITHLVLLAPFEGRYREVGYNALYAARLALADNDTPSLVLLPIDDGGSVDSAVDRAQAIVQNPQNRAVLLVGIHASSEPVQRALGDLPVLVVGHWETQPYGENAVLLTNPRIDAALAAAESAGSERLALPQTPLLHDDIARLRIFSSATLPDAAFQQRYVTSAPFAPEPLLFAPLTYDATQIAIQMLSTETPLQQMRYAGLHGSISFENGYWQDAPLHEYRYEQGELVPVGTP